MDRIRVHVLAISDYFSPNRYHESRSKQMISQRRSAWINLPWEEL